MPRVRVELSTGPSEVQYLRSGAGPGVVLVHGTAATPDTSFAPLIAALEERYTVVAPYLSGSGTTTDSGGPLGVEDLARQVLAAARDAGLDTFHLVGHSLGACVAAAVAGTEPDRVRSALLHAGWVRTDTRLDHQFQLWEALLRTDPVLLARLILLTAFREGAPQVRDPDALRAETAGFAGLLRSDGVGRQLQVDRSVDIEPLLGRVTAPTLVVAGEHDTVIPPSHQVSTAALIPGARLVRVAAGHAFPFESPEEFTALAADFLDSRDADVLEGAG